MPDRGPLTASQNQLPGSRKTSEGLFQLYCAGIFVFNGIQWRVQSPFLRHGSLSIKSANCFVFYFICKSTTIFESRRRLPTRALPRSIIQGRLKGSLAHHQVWQPVRSSLLQVWNLSSSVRLWPLMTNTSLGPQGCQLPACRSALAQQQQLPAHPQN